MSNRRGLSARQRFERFLAASRLFIVVPVVFLLVDAAGSFVYGCIIFVTTVGDVVHEPGRTGAILGRFLIVLDAFLVGATLMIAAFGFYALFVDGRREGTPSLMPGWLKMHDLEDLKARVVSMLILVAAITFVDVAVETRSEIGVFYLGIGIAIVIGALTAFLRFGRQAHAAQAVSQDGPDSDRSRDHPRDAGQAGRGS